MILKLLVFVATILIIRSKSVWTESTSKPSLPKDLQELLDSLYMTGYIPEYILPEDELTETEKTEGEYLDFPELKNAQENVFVPPESEYSKNHLHYKNIKARKRLVPNRYKKIKLSGTQQEIQNPEISPEELRSDLLAPLVENFTGKEQKNNTTIKLDFLIPIPERGVYPHNSGSTELFNLNPRSGSNERSDSTELCNSIEHISSIEQYNVRQTQHNSSRQPQWYSLRSTEPGNSETIDRCDSEKAEQCGTETTDLCNTESTEGCNPVSIEICDSKTTQCVNSRPNELCDAVQTEPMNNKKITPQPNGIFSNQQESMNTLNPQGSMQILNPQVPMNKSNPQDSMKVPNPQGFQNTPNPQGFMNTPNPQWPMQIFNQQKPINIPNPLGFMKTLNTQLPTNISNPPGSINIPNQPIRFMNTPGHNGTTNWNSSNKECTQCTISKQYSFTIPELPNMPKYPLPNTNTTMYQPLTFEIISPKTEKNIDIFQFTVAMQPQPNVTIKPALEKQIKNMLNIQQWTKQLLPQFIVNTKQPERTSALDIKSEKQYAPSSVVPRINITIHASEQQTIRTGLDNSSRRVDLKTIDKNIATNVVSLMADPLSINKMEAEGVKAAIKPSISVNSEVKQNAETYFDRQSNNSSGIIIPSGQNPKNKGGKNISQNLLSNSTGKENADSGKPKKKMFTFLNIFKKNKKFVPSDKPGQSNSTQRKREIIEDSSNELYRQLLETNGMSDYNYVECQFPMKQELEEEETFNHKRKKK